MNLKDLTLKSSIVVASALPVFAFADDGASGAADYAKDAFDSIKTEATNLIGYAWPVVVLIVGAIIGMKLFKKFANKAG